MATEPKKVVITGASSGLGAATARLLAGKGYVTVLLARNAAKLNEVAGEIRAAGGTAHTYSVDLSDATAAGRVCSSILRDVGVPDVVVNNAGAGIWKEIEATTMRENVENMAVPYFAAFNVTRVFIGPMLKANRGHVINVSSPAGVIMIPGAVSYAVARHAMRGFSEQLHADLFHTKIAVTMYCPGRIDTPYFDNNPGTLERIPSATCMIPILSEKTAAEHVFKIIRRRPRVYYAPWMLGVFVWFHRFFPWIVNSLSIRTGWRRK